MKFELPSLPFAKDALEPYLGAGTVEVHYEKHHRGYVSKLKEAIEGKPEAGGSLEDLVRSASGSLLENAAQAWNHTFYWRSLAPGGGGKPSGEILSEIERHFGTYEAFKQSFAEAATGHFGSGWAWLVAAPSGRLEVISTHDADNPLRAKGRTPLLTIDVWEHAYYLDYRNERDSYVKAFIDHLLNWDFVGSNLRALGRR